MQNTVSLENDPTLFEIGVLSLTKKSFNDKCERLFKKKDEENQFKAVELSILIKAINQRLTTLYEELNKKYPKYKDKLEAIKNYNK